MKFVPVIVTLAPTVPLDGLKLVIVGAGGGAVTVKFVELVAVPPPVVTLHAPVEAPDGTVAEICVAELTVKVAAVAPSLTDVAPLKFVPVIVTLVLTGPLDGLKLVIVGAGGGEVTVKLVELVAVPPAVLTLHGPVVAPLGTVAVIDVAEFTTYVAATPFNATLFAPVNRVPVSVTDVPEFPLVGVKLVSVGGLTVKFVELVAVPPGVVTLHAPVGAFAGTVAVIEVSDTTVNVAPTPLSVTDDAFVKPDPLSVTVRPANPLAGEKLVSVGAGTVTVKLPLLVAVPPGVTTCHWPELALDGTVAVIDVDELTVYGAAVPASVTELAPVKPVPVRVTLSPDGPLPGLKLVIVGTGEAVTVKLLADDAVPPAVVTLHAPEVAPAGTVALICVAEVTVNEAAVPFSATALVPLRFVPVSVTLVPTGPLDGLKLESVGAGAGPVVRVTSAKPYPGKLSVIG